MLRYEVLLLTVPEITADETTGIESYLSKTLTDKGAQPTSFDRWGKYYLAYPVRKNDYGVYFLMRFECSDERHKEIIDAVRVACAVKFADLVMRHMIVHLEERDSLEYQRPESLEETPSRDVDSFLKENKMTGLMGKPGRSRHNNDALGDIESGSKNFEGL
ncbi:MAG: 30S ribosomal protein S6 [Candidatus Babeliaceae bacterium]|jgi:ribosomal protein S6